MAKDELREDEVSEILSRPFYTPGKAYRWTLTQGWCRVGFFLGYGQTPLEIRVAHCSYYRSAGNQTHASLSVNGGNSETEWEYCGHSQLLLGHIISVDPYEGEVPRGR